MQLTQKQLNNLSVYTVSGIHLGQISGFVIDVNQHIVSKYFVNKSSLVKELLSAIREDYDLEIAPAQVVRVSDQKMIVEDSVQEEVLAKINKNKNMAMVEPTLTSSLDRS
ncbi:MAG: hypothetical protein V1898_00685 [Patescibacteria group bacterium]